MAHVLSSTVITAYVVALTAVSCAKKETPISVVRTTDNHFVFMLPDEDKPGHYDRAIAVFYEERPPVANLPTTLPVGAVRFSDHEKKVVLAESGGGMIIFGFDKEKVQFWSEEVSQKGQHKYIETYGGCYGISDTHGDWDASKVTAAGTLDLLTLMDMNEGLPLAQR